MKDDTKFYGEFSSHTEIAYAEKTAVLEAAKAAGVVTYIPCLDVTTKEVNYFCYNFTIPKALEWNSTKPDSGTKFSPIQAIEFFNNLKEPGYKVGDWVVWEGIWYNSGNKLGKIIRFHDAHIDNLLTDGYRAMGAESRITRLATKEEEKFALIEEANHKYPIGTKFKDLQRGNIRTVSAANHSVFETEDSGLIVSVGHTPESEWKDSCSNPCLYLNNKWAEIVKETKFKIGGYVVEYDGGSEFKVDSNSYPVKVLGGIVNLPKLKSITFQTCSNDLTLSLGELRELYSYLMRKKDETNP